jgi:glycerol kinase
VGITRGTNRCHIIRAAEESIAYQVTDLVRAMEKDSGFVIPELKADGGASRDNFLMQFQADISGCAIIRPVIRETTALGAACLAGIAAGFWKSADELETRWKRDDVFTPSMDIQKRASLLSGWHKAVGRSHGWADNNSKKKFTTEYTE